MAYERKLRAEYRIEKWKNHRELEELLNRMCNDGWRADSHRLNAKGQSGWTIFAKHTLLNQPLLDRTINVGEVYRILNAVLEAGSPQSREFDSQIKQAVRQEGDYI